MTTTPPTPPLPAAPVAAPPRGLALRGRPAKTTIPAADFDLPAEFLSRAKEAYGHAWAERTVTEYQRYWAAFERWCTEHGRQALPAAPATVVAFLLDIAPKLSLSALQLARAAIGWFHRGSGFDPPPTKDPAVGVNMRTFRRQKGIRSRHAKEPLTLDLLTRLVERIDRTRLQGLRDAALILTGFAPSLTSFGATEAST